MRVREIASAYRAALGGGNGELRIAAAGFPQACIIHRMTCRRRNRIDRRHRRGQPRQIVLDLASVGNQNNDDQDLASWHAVTRRYGALSGSHCSVQFALPLAG